MPKLVNDYLSKNLPDKDSRACAVCYRPTSHVLVTDSKLDTLHACPSHMKDRCFAMPNFSHPDHAPYKRIKVCIKELLVEKATLCKQIEDSKPAIWAQLWDSPVGSRRRREEDSEPRLPPIPSVPQLKQLLSQTELRLSHKEDELAGYRFQRYKLDKTIFTSRALSKRSTERPRLNSRKPIIGTLFPRTPPSNMQ